MRLRKTGAAGARADDYRLAFLWIRVGIGRPWRTRYLISRAAVDPQQMMAARGFPAPWTVEEYRGISYIVRETNRFAVAYVYFETEADARRQFS